MRDEDDPAGDAPARLVRDLQALHPRGDVPAAIDRELVSRSVQALEAVRRQPVEELDATQDRSVQELEAPQRRRFLLLRGISTAAAAGLLLWLFLEFRGRAPVAPEDVDGSGRVDILDAYALALRIEQQDLDPSERRRFDLSGDGVLDRGDVDLVASAAVRIGS